MEEQMQRMQRLENLGMLSAGIAHDFNNALAPIFMAGPMLRGHLHDPGGRHILDVMEKSAERSVALVRQLLTFARGSATGRQSLEVRQVTQEVLELAESTFPKSIRLARDLPAGLWPVQGNPTQLHQVFLNLCVNARDAMPQGGELKLTAANCTLDSATAAGMPDAHPGDFVRVEVRDTGTGIPPEVLARIWEPFYTTKGEGKGTGLGLSTVRGLLHQHEGFATVQTQAGHGTAFTVYLPAARGAAETEGAAEAASPARGNGELVLVVDDEELVCELVGTILTAHGYRTLTAGDGAAAIAVFATRAAEVRLLLTDLQMPMLGGPALATALRRMNPNLPIIAMSGADSRSDTAHREFTSAFLAKPFQPETLLSIVRRTLDAARPPAA
jgi:CheY-like chemotaxis protein